MDNKRFRKIQDAAERYGVMVNSPNSGEITMRYRPGDGNEYKATFSPRMVDLVNGLDAAEGLITAIGNIIANRLQNPYSVADFTRAAKS